MTLCLRSSSQGDFTNVTGVWSGSWEGSLFWPLKKKRATKIDVSFTGVHVLCLSEYKWILFFVRVNIRSHTDIYFMVEWLYMKRYIEKSTVSAAVVAYCRHRHACLKDIYIIRHQEVRMPTCIRSTVAVNGRTEKVRTSPAVEWGSCTFTTFQYPAVMKRQKWIRLLTEKREREILLLDACLGLMGWVMLYDNW
jgi:hypothetical protein